MEFNSKQRRKSINGIRLFAGASLDENSGAFCELKANFF
mgnify:CR=1 FL=1